MKVYVVTSGEYSDYFIEAVFLDKDKAAVYCAAHNNPESYYLFGIEEYDLMDDNVESSGSEEIMYRLFVNRPDLKKPYVSEPLPMLKQNIQKEIAKHRDIQRMSFNQSDFPYGDKFVYLKEPNKEKAWKIVQDRYAQWHAEREGI